MTLKRSLIAISVATVLAGCAATAPRSLPEKSFKSEENTQAAASAEWTTPAVQKDGRPYMVLVTPMTPPKELKDKPVSLSFESGTTVRDLVAVLANLGYSVMLGDDTIGDKEFYLPRYKGTLGGLMAAVSRTADVWFTWHEGVVTVNAKERVMLSVPQDEGLAAKLEKGLGSMGLTGEDALVSFNAGMLSLEMKPSQFNKVRAYLERMTTNAALVTLQVAIVTVNMNHNVKQGVDWGKMQLALGKNNNYILQGLTQNSGIGGGSTTTTTTTLPTQTTAPSTGTNTPAPSTTTTTTTSQQSTGAALADTILAGGSGLRAVTSNSLFSLIGFVDFLNGYGITETKQNVVLKTVAGNQVELKSVTQIPYVSGVSVSTTGGTGTNGSLMGSTQTATANDGITLKMLPAFDAYSNTVTVKMELSIQAVVGFNNLSAGSQVGSLSQPTTAERSFNDIIRVRPGQTVVVGGLTYDSIGDTRSAPAFLTGSKLEHKDLTVNRLTMFIVVRPTITVLGAMTEKEAAEFDLVEGANPPDLDESEPTEKPKKASAKSKKNTSKE